MYRKLLSAGVALGLAGLCASAASAGTTEIVDGRRTATWGYNGAILGPTLRARRGETVAVEFENGLPEPTTLHWHGVHLPARCDGGPHQTVQPGDRWEPSWTIRLKKRLSKDIASTLRRVSTQYMPTGWPGGRQK